MLRFSWNKIDIKINRSSKNSLSLLANAIIFITDSTGHVPRNKRKPCDIKNIEVMVM
jgi:hypothetical protein